MQFRAYIACIKYHSSGSRARVGGAPALRCAPVGAVRRRLQFTCVAVPWSRPAAARCPDRPALGAAPTATLRAGYRVRLARIVRAYGATKHAIWRNRCAIVRATRRQIVVWCNPLLGRCAVPAWLSPQFLPAARGCCAPARLRPARYAGGNPPAPPIRIKRIVGTARDAYASCPAIQPNRRETITRGRANLGGIPPAPRYLPICSGKRIPTIISIIANKISDSKSTRSRSVTETTPKIKKSPTLQCRGEQQRSKNQQT